MEVNTAQIHLFSSGGKSVEFSNRANEMPWESWTYSVPIMILFLRLDEVLEQGAKNIYSNICFYFLKQKKLQSSSTILFYANLIFSYC